MDLKNVKNMRDIASAHSLMKENLVIRTGCPSKATTEDIENIRSTLNVKVLIDLRSQAEIDEDENLKSPVYDGFCDFQYNKRERIFLLSDKNHEVDTDCSRRRYFISLMSEDLIKKSVFLRFRKRTRFKAIGLYLISLISRKAEKQVRNIFLDKINSGGLSLLYEFVVDNSGIEIIEVLKIIAEPANYPLCFYCTAGKDRTGLVTMLLLSIVGATDEDIIDDYVLSDNAYKDINDAKAMVASLKQAEVDPNTFLRAKPHVMRETIHYIRSKYGSINSYLDKHGFDEQWRNKLRKAALKI